MSYFYEYDKVTELLGELFGKIQETAIASKVIYVKSVSDKIFVYTTTELSASEITILSDTVNNFQDSIENLKVPKILRLAKAEAKEKHFHNIIYTSNKDLSNSLYDKRTTTQGEVTQVCWYEECSYIVYQGLVAPIFRGLVIKVDIEYDRDSTGFAMERETRRTYINEDGSENPDVKISRKVYYSNDDAQIKEGIKRRKQLVASIQKPTLEAMVQVLLPKGQNQTMILLQGREFMTDYHLDFAKFVDESASNTDYTDEIDFNKKLVVIRLENESRPDRVLWLDATAPSRLGGNLTIRQYLISEFSI